MNTFQSLMKRKGFCILFIKYLIIKVFLTRCVWCDSRLFKGLANPSTPRWAATVTVWPAILSSHRPLSHTSPWVSVGSCRSWGLHRETEGRSQFLSWAGEFRQQQPLELVLRQPPASCWWKWSGRRDGWWNLSGMSETVMSRRSLNTV